MVPRKIIIIDDEKTQVEALTKTLQQTLSPQYSLMKASSEKEIQGLINTKFFNLAILDIRMDDYECDGISLAERIIEINPYAKIIFVSRYIQEYLAKISPLLSAGNVLAVIEKKVDYDKWAQEMKPIIENYYHQLDEDPQVIQSALLEMYSKVKDEEDHLKKGYDFENFISLLFQSMGYNEVIRNVKDKSGNETDLIIRNEIDDSFLSKFGKYLLIECKNRPEEHTNKNDYTLFLSKLEASNGMADLGFIITTSTFTRTAYLEALRTSKGNKKIIFIDNPLILSLIKAENPRKELKKIIDSQVKDNPLN